MSLEQKIDKLTVAIEALTVAMTSGSIAAMSAGEVITELKETVTETVGDVSTEKTTEKKTTEKKPTGKDACKEINEKSKQKAIDDCKKRNEEKAAKETKVVSAEELKAACLTAARSAPDAKAKVKALLKEFDATVVKDVAEADRPTILARLEKGEF